MLGIDKTYNLSGVLVTVAVYKCLSVKRRDTDAHPIFCGPLSLHGNSHRDTFFRFFQHLSGRLLDCAQLPVLGSDEEMVLRQAMALAFPHTPRLVCKIHKLIENILQAQPAMSGDLRAIIMDCH